MTNSSLLLFSIIKNKKYKATKYKIRNGVATKIIKCYCFFFLVKVSLRKKGQREKDNSYTLLFQLIHNVLACDTASSFRDYFQNNISKIQVP